MSKSEGAVHFAVNLSSHVARQLHLRGACLNALAHHGSADSLRLYVCITCYYYTGEKRPNLREAESEGGNVPKRVLKDCRYTVLVGEPGHFFWPVLHLFYVTLLTYLNCTNTTKVSQSYTGQYQKKSGRMKPAMENIFQKLSNQGVTRSTGPADKSTQKGK